MAKKRKEMTENQKEKQRQADRESKASRRAAKKKPSRFVNTSEVKKKYIEHEREFNRLYKVRVRSERTDAEHEFELINNLLCMRRLRRSLSDEEQESDKVIAKEGMISGTGLQGVANNTWISLKPRSQSLLKR